MDAELAELSFQTGDFLRSRGWRLATAESCTGGWVAEVVTATAGSSNWFDRGLAEAFVDDVGRSLRCVYECLLAGLLSLGKERDHPAILALVLRPR